MVERFERRERTPINEDQTNATLTTTYEKREKILTEDQNNASPILATISEKRERILFNGDPKNTSSIPHTICETDKSPNVLVSF